MGVKSPDGGAVPCAQERPPGERTAWTKRMPCGTAPAVGTPTPEMNRDRLKRHPKALLVRCQAAPPSVVTSRRGVTYRASAPTRSAGMPWPRRTQTSSANLESDA